MENFYRPRVSPATANRTRTGTRISADAVVDSFQTQYGPGMRLQDLSSSPSPFDDANEYAEEHTHLGIEGSPVDQGYFSCQGAMMSRHNYDRGRAYWQFNSSDSNWPT